MTRLGDDAPVPDLHLERYRLGELPEDERARVDRRLEAEPGLRERLASMAASDAEFARLHPAPAMAERIRDRARAAGPPPPAAARSRTGRLWLFPALAAAALVLAVGVTTIRPRPPAGDIRLKGGDAELVVLRKTPTGSERLEPGALARKGDLIRIGYRAAGRAYGAILSTDGNGNVTQHLPPAGEHATALTAGGTVLLEFAYELDAAPRWEHFYLVTGDEAFALGPVREAAREAASAGAEQAPPRLRLAPGLTQSVFSLTKERLQ